MLVALRTRPPAQGPLGLRQPPAWNPGRALSTPGRAGARARGLEHPRATGGPLSTRGYRRRTGSYAPQDL
eukprot:12543347-Alexandrium_andersonii.AAC.1